MTLKSKHALTKAAVKELHGDSARERLLHRLHSVVLVLNGTSSSAVAQMFDDSPRAVAYWVKRFKRHGIAGLHEAKRPGRPSKLHEHQLTHLQTFVNQSTAQSKPISADVVAAYIFKKFRISLTPRQCWRILKRLTT
jgi:transposase